jgi:integrase
MSIRKRTWQTKDGESSAFGVYYYDEEGAYRLKTFETHRETKAWEHRMRVDLEKGLHRPDSTSETIRFWGQKWLEQCERDDLDEVTIAGYRTSVETHMNPLTASSTDDAPAWRGEFGDLKVSRLTAPVCEVFRDELVGLHSRHTARKILITLKRVLSHAQKRGAIAYNPATETGIKERDREKVRLRIGEHIPTKAEVRRMLEASTGFWEAFIATAAFAGPRLSELRALRWPLVHLDKNTVEIVDRADKKGRIGYVKTQAGNREIHISDILVDVLERWSGECPRTGPGLVFPRCVIRNPRTSREVLNGSEIYDGWREIQRRLGFVRPSGYIKYGPHALRHFFASITIEQGTSPKRLQALMGHKTLAVTMDRYAHLFPPGEDELARSNKAAERVLLAQPEDDRIRFWDDNA